MNDSHQLLADLRSGLPPHQLYHYTSPAGLMGIVAHRDIWATDIRYLNDSAEFAYAVKLLEFTLWDHISVSPSKRTEENRFCASLMKAVTKTTVAPLYVTSFTEEGDLLSQWRAYGPALGGYSIGFTGTALDGIRGSVLLRCVYESGQQRALIRRIVDSSLEQFRAIGQLGVANGETEQYWGPIQGRFTFDFSIVAATIKHNGFAEENEWRLLAGGIITDSPDRVHFRAGRSGIVPYVKLRLSEEAAGLPITEVIVGPNPHMELAEIAVDHMLSQDGLASVPVHGSRIPYRAW